MNPKIDLPKDCAGSSIDEWRNLIRDLGTSKTMCSVKAVQVNIHLMECVKQHYLYNIKVDGTNSSFEDSHGSNR